MIRGSPLRIQPIVEGHGETQAVPVLLRRLLIHAAAYEIQVSSPVRRHRSQLVTRDGFRRAVELAKLQVDAAALLVLIDGDDDCPAELGPTLQQWINEDAGPVPARVVVAHREYESWFLATAESLRGTRGIRLDADADLSAESHRDAKSRLESLMQHSRSYSETADQPAMSERFDLGLAFRRCRSFRKLVSAFFDLVTGCGVSIESWPPPAWLDEPTPP